MVDATEIFHDLCWMLECQLATLEGLKDVKRTAKREIQRHTDIAQPMVIKVWAYRRDYGFGIDPRKTRVVEAVRRLDDGEDS